jgi:sRNA-binding protein
LTKGVHTVLDLLAERWPKMFSLYEARRRPLKVGIHRDILAALHGGGITPDELKRALSHYCRNPGYCAAAKKAAEEAEEIARRDPRLSLADFKAAALARKAAVPAE